MMVLFLIIIRFAWYEQYYLTWRILSRYWNHFSVSFLIFTFVPVSINIQLYFKRKLLIVCFSILNVASMLFLQYVWKIYSVISHYPSNIVLGHYLSYPFCSVQLLISFSLLDIKCIESVSLLKNLFWIAQNTNPEIIL